MPGQSEGTAGMNQAIRQASGRYLPGRLNLSLQPGVVETLRGVAKEAGLVTRSRGELRGNVAALLNVLAQEFRAGRLRVSPIQVSQD